MNRSRKTADLASHGNIFVDIDNDRVGIGTTQPTHKIDVSGNIKLHDHTGYQNHITYKSSGPAPHLHFPTGPLANLARTPYLGFGDRGDASGDFKIYHDHYNAHLKLNANFGGGYGAGLGGLFISNHSTSGVIGIQGANGSGAAQNSIYIPAGATAGVKIYQAGQLRFETVGYGVTVHGTTETQELNVTGIVTSSAAIVNGETILNGNVSFYGSNYGAIWRKNNNRFTLNDNAELTFGNGNDTTIKHNNSHLLITNTTGNIDVTGNVVLNNDLDVTGLLTATQNGAVELYYNNSKKLETTSVGVTVTGELRPVGNLVMNTSDNLKILFGASNDLQIFHDGSHSRIKDVGTGILSLSASQCNIQNAAVNENMAEFFENGAVNLYYDNVKRFETTSSGIQVTGDITVPTSVDSTDAGGVAIQRFWSFNLTNGNIYKCGHWVDGEGSVQLLISVRSITASNSGTSTYIFQGGFRALDGTGNGDGDFHRRLMPLASGGGHGNGPDQGLDSSGGWEVLINQKTSYTYELVIHVPSGRANKSLQIAVTELNRGNNFTDVSSSAAYSSINVNSNPLLPSSRNYIGTGYLRDYSKLNFGNSNDLQIYHSPNSSYIDNNTNHLYIRSNVDGDDNGNIYIQALSGENSIICNDDGAVELYHDNSKKFETSSSGATVTGTLTATAFSGDGSTLTGIDATTIKDSGGTVRVQGTTSGIVITGITTTTGNLNLNGRLIANEGSPPATGYNHFISDDGSATTIGQAATLRVANNGNNAAYSVFEAESGSGSIRLANDGAFYVTGGTKFSNQIRVDITGTVDGIVGQAYNTYFGLKHSDQTLNSEYMIISKDFDTFISATSGYNVRIRAGGNDSTNELQISSGNDALTWRGNKVFHAGNDGAGSGLDADTLDGVSSGSFLRSDAADAVTSYSNQIRYYSNSAIPSSSGSQASLEVFSGNGAGTDAFMAFHVSGDFACYLGLDGGTNKLSVGGWSMGANSYAIYHEGNNPTFSQLGITASSINALGINATTVDSIDGGSFLRSDTDDVLTKGSMTTISASLADWMIRFVNNNGTNAYVYMSHGTHGMHIRNDSSTTGTYLLDVYAANGNRFRVRGADALVTSNGNTMWHAGNDGSGSGLDADTVDGLHVGGTGNNGANQIVRTQANGYIFSSFINTSSGDTGTGSDCTRFYASQDAYLRYIDLGSMRSVMNVSAVSGVFSGREDQTGDSNYWVGSMGWGSQNFDTTVWDYGSCFFDVWSNPSGQPSGTSHWQGFQAMHYTNQSSRYGFRITCGAGNPAYAYIQGRWNTTTYGWHKLWNAANDGSGSGLDADTLDGQQGSYYKDVPSGTVMVFRQNSAPTGWTKSTSHNNKAMRIVNGNVGSGGSNSFSTAFNSSRGTSGGSVSNHTISTAQMPSHTHIGKTTTHDSNSANSQGYPANNNHQSHRTSDRGRTHNMVSAAHANTGSSNSHNHGFSNPSINLNVQYLDFIICTRS